MTFVKLTRAYREDGQAAEVYISPAAVTSFEPGPNGVTVLVVAGQRLSVQEGTDDVRAKLAPY